MCKLTKKQPASLIGGLKKYLCPYVIIYELITHISLTAMPHWAKTPFLFPPVRHRAH